MFMAIITYPVTKQRAQVGAEEDAPAIEHADTVTYVAVDCPACRGQHWVDFNTGRLLGQDPED